MFRFFSGRSGSGKTAAIFRQIKERVENGENDIFMLIPDQSSFQTETDLLRLLGAANARKVTVFGFDGLCRHVFEQTSKTPRNVIDDGTRAVLMSIALEQLTDKLTLLKPSKGRSLTELMLQTLKECKKNGITAEMLMKAGEGMADSTLKTKLCETALVFSAFDALLSQSYIDPLDNLQQTEIILSENQNLFKNSVLYVDSFSGFTAVQLRVLRILLNRCRDCVISLTMDPESGDRSEVFATTRKSQRSLLRIAALDNIEVKAPVKFTEPKRFANPELAMLEKGAFGGKKGDVYDKPPENVILYTAADVYDECRFIARQIKHLVMDGGLLYEDIAVIGNDLKPYRTALAAAFERYEIPYFTDSPRDADVKPPVRLVNAVFRMAVNGFSREDVLSFFKSGLTGHADGDINEFENYIYIWNINGAAFREPFTQNPRGFAESFTASDTEVLDTVERLRRAVTEPVTRFKEDCRGKNVREISERLYRLLEELHVPENLSLMYDSWEENGGSGTGAEQLRVWAALMDSLDKTVAAAGDLPITLKRYFELLSIQIASREFREIPRTMDCVSVTTAQRVRNSRQKVSILIGCNDGVFPAVPHASGLFSAFELKTLSDGDLRIGDDFSELSDLENFMTYCCLSSASHKLYCCCPLTGAKGESLSPSVIFREAAAVFPKLEILDRANFSDNKEDMLAPVPAFEAFSASLGEGRTELRGLREIFENDPGFASKTRAVERALDKTPFEMEDPRSPELLFGDGLSISASQLEKFSMCRFAWFCSYGLRVRERLRADINPMEYGTLVHYALEKFFSQYSKNEYTQMDDEALKCFINAIIDEYTERCFGGAQNRSGAFLFKLDMLRENLLLLLKHLSEEMAQSDFDAADCELSIGGDIPAYTLELPTGQRIAVCGSVDRVDIMRHDGGVYLRVVDYKTGGKEFKLSDILYGLNLQMLLYLHSIEKNGGERYGEITPAGVLYMPAVTPVIAADSLDPEGIQKEIGKTFRMNGLLLDDVRVIKGMDKSEAGEYIPVKIKEGSAEPCKSLISLEQFGALFKKLDLTVAEMGRALYGGRIGASPVKGAHDACEYCPYDTVCGYRQGEPRNTFSVDNAEVFEILKKEREGGEDNEQ